MRTWSSPTARKKRRRPRRDRNGLPLEKVPVRGRRPKHPAPWKRKNTRRAKRRSQRRRGRPHRSRPRFPRVRRLPAGRRPERQSMRRPESFENASHQRPLFQEDHQFNQPFRVVATMQFVRSWFYRPLSRALSKSGNSRQRSQTASHASAQRVRLQGHFRCELLKRFPSELLPSVKREYPFRRTRTYVPASAETGDQGTEKSGINFWEGGGKRTKGLRSASRIPEVRSAERRRQGKRSPETTRSTGTGRRNKRCRSHLPLHDSTERREISGLRGSRRKPMPFRRTTDRRPRLSSSRDCTRPLPKRK